MPLDSVGHDRDTPPSSPIERIYGSDDEDGVLSDDGELQEVLTLNGEGVDDEEGEDVEDDDGVEDDAMETLWEDMSRLTLQAAHDGSVFSCCVSADGRLAASGGEDDSCAVWRLDTGRQLVRIDGARDSVTQTAFSADGRRLAVADMSGLVRVFDISTLQAGDAPASQSGDAPASQSGDAPVPQPRWQMETDADLTWLQWHPTAAGLLLAGTVDGDGWLWRLARDGQLQTRLLAGAGSSCTCGVVLPTDGLRVAMGYEDGSVGLLQLKSGRAERRLEAGGNAAAVSCLDAQPGDGALIAAGRLDGTVSLYAVAEHQLPRLLGRLDCGGSPVNDSDAVEQLAFCPAAPTLLLCLTTVGHVTVWDVTSQRARHRLYVDACVSRWCWAPGQPRGYIGCLDGAVRPLDLRTGQLDSQLTSVSCCHLLDMAVSADGSTLVTAMDDGNVCVFSVAGSCNT